MKKIISNKTFKNIVASIAFIAILALILLRTNEIFKRTFNHNWYIDQRREQVDDLNPDDVDIIYIGGSKVSVGVIPIEIWKNTGLKGVNLATNTQPPIATKYILKEYAGKLKPRYVLMEPAGILSNSSLEKSAAYRYPIVFQFFNKLGKTKLLLNDLSADYPGESTLEFRFPLYRDHSRWKSLSKHDFVTVKDYDSFNLGFINEYPIRDFEMTLEDKVYYSEYLENPRSVQSSERHYQEIVDYLKDSGIEIIIISMPDLQNSLEKNSRVKLFAEKNNLSYLDFSINPVFDEMGFENKGDFYDKGHLTITGAMKYSRKLSETLTHLLKIEDFDEDKIYSSYYKDFIELFDKNKGKYTKYYEETQED